LIAILNTTSKTIKGYECLLEVSTYNKQKSCKNHLRLLSLFVEGQLCKFARFNLERVISHLGRYFHWIRYYFFLYCHRFVHLELCHTTTCFGSLKANFNIIYSHY